MKEEIIKIAEQIDDINDIEDYKTIFKALSNNRLYFQLITGTALPTVPVNFDEKTVKEALLEAAYAESGNDPEVFQNPDEYLSKRVDVTLPKFEGIKYFTDNGYVCKASCLKNQGLKTSFSLEVELTKELDNGFKEVIKFEDERYIFCAEPEEIFTSIYMINPDMKDIEINFRLNAEELYYVNDISKHLLAVYPDPHHILGMDK